MTPPRRCPRCDGTLLRNYDDDASCLMCGWVDEGDVLPIEQAMEEAQRRKVGRPGVDLYVAKRPKKR